MPLRFSSPAVSGPRLRGLVFALGDPWLYNEYMDARRLPPDFDNALTGENLFRWLLEQATPVVWE